MKNVMRLALLMIVAWQLGLYNFQISYAAAPTRPEPAANSIVTLSDSYLGMWISAEELANLPTTGSAWDRLKEVAGQKASTPDLSNQDDPTNVVILAKALVYARTGESKYQADVVTALKAITFDNTESGGRTLALGRELAAYVISADLIGLADYDSNLDTQFRNKLRELLTKNLDGRTLRSTHEDRPNNWGTHAGASRAAVAVYLGDSAELEQTAQVFKGWLGDRGTYAGFKYGDLSWQCDPTKPVGINPKGCVKEGHSLDGALPEELRRSGSFQWPPKETVYAWEGLQGALVQAEILHRAGYPAWEWEDKALLRAVQFLYDIGWQAEGDDEWQPWLVNHAYGTNFPTTAPARTGKNIGWTDWTHSSTSDAPSPTATPQPTQTPIPTSTPVPFDTYLTIEFDQQEVSVGDIADAKITIHNAANLYGLEVHCTADPTILYWQSAQFGDFFTDPIIGTKNLNPDGGAWSGAISQKNPAPALSGDGTFAIFSFEAVTAGTTSITCTPLASNRDGFEMPIGVLDGSITVLDNSGLVGSMEGIAIYQGRAEHTGIEITLTGPTDKVADTDPTGQFTVRALNIGTYEIKADAALHLPSCTTSTVNNGQVTTLAPTLLVGGDTDDNDEIKINDATLLGSNFGLTVSSTPAMDDRADINNDGQVNILDLSILGSNFGRQGCQQWTSTSSQS